MVFFGAGGRPQHVLDALANWAAVILQEKDKDVVQCFSFYWWLGITI
jgi:hypothetical protein